LPEPQGPWNFPPAAPPPTPPVQRRRLSTGLMIWLGLLVACGLGFWGLTQVFPGQFSGGDGPAALQALGVLALVSSAIVIARRTSLSIAARNMAIWVGIGAAILVGYSFRAELTTVYERARGEIMPASSVASTTHSVTYTASDDGHFYVMGWVNGKPIRFVIDTGASAVVLSPADAQRAGFDPATLKYDLKSETANGEGSGAAVTAATLAVGDNQGGHLVRINSVVMEVNSTPMSASLLGMSFLSRLDAVEVHGNQMTFHWH
jgi:aspartyl protease family protein